MKPGLVTAEEIGAFLEIHREWVIENHRLHRQYHFKDFMEAFGFMTQVAMLAERSDHHPEWSNTYNRVTVDLVTHSAKGITVKDLDMADKMERIFHQITGIPKTITH